MYYLLSDFVQRLEAKHRRLVHVVYTMETVCRYELDV